MSLSEATSPFGAPARSNVSGTAGFAHIDTQGLHLADAPINPDWVISGTPRARAATVAQGSDVRATLAVWECTAGRFHWHFGCDEAVYILEGAVSVKAPDGTVRHLTAGDLAHFPAGTWFEWTVGEYVRKVAFCHDIAPPPARLPLKAYAKMERLIQRVFQRQRPPGA